MSRTTKPPTKLDYEQSIRGSYNDVNSTLSVDGFVVGKIGHKIVLETPEGEANVEEYSFFDGDVLLYKIRVTYTTELKLILSSVERIA